MLTLTQYLAVAGILFAVGMYGALAKRNAVVILMCVEIMLNAVNLTLVAFSRYVAPAALTGQAFAIFVLAVAAAEASVGLAIVLAVYRRRNTIAAEEVDLMRW